MLDPLSSVKEVGPMRGLDPPVDSHGEVSAEQFGLDPLSHVDITGKVNFQAKVEVSCRAVERLDLPVDPHGEVSCQAVRDWNHFHLFIPTRKVSVRQQKARPALYPMRGKVALRRNPSLWILWGGNLSDSYGADSALCHDGVKISYQAVDRLDSLSYMREVGSQGGLLELVCSSS